MQVMKLAARPALASSRVGVKNHISFGHPAVQHYPRLVASRAQGNRNNDDKSWSELATDAAQIAKTAVTKLKDSIQTAAGSLLKQTPEAPKPARQQPSEDLFPGRPTSLLGGLVGRAVGSLLGSAVETLSKQMAETAKESNAAYEEAAFRIKNDDRIKDRLGSVQCSQPLSQSVSSSSINGRLSKTVSLLFAVYGSNGRSGQAQVQTRTDPSGANTSDITVQLQNGEVIKVGAGNRSGAAGETIDVDYWEVK